MIYFIYPNVDIWQYMVDGINDPDIICRPLNPNCNMSQLVCRKLLSKYKLPAYMILGHKLRKELRSLDKGDTVLVADYVDVCLFHAISSILKPTVRKCLWIWNPVKIHLRNKMYAIYRAIEESGFKIGTFDQGDAERYSQQAYGQFFRMEQDPTEEKEEYDFYFIGFEKNRGAILNELKEKLKDYRCYFKIINQVSECIPYAQNIVNIKKARCIIEIVQDGQDGITLRPLEAIACGKKLLTNNKNIKKYDFYSPQNFFILGEDSLDDISQFINSSPTPLQSSIRNQYDIASWLNHYRQ